MTFNVDKCVFISTDTTGVNSDDELLGITLINANNEIVYKNLVRPVYKTSWLEAEEIHLICPGDIKIYGISTEELELDLLNVLKDYSHIIMYNADFHQKFIPKASITNQNIICAMQWSLAYINNHPEYSGASTFLKLPVLVDLLGIELYQEKLYHSYFKNSKTSAQDILNTDILNTDAEVFINSTSKCLATRLVWLEMIKNHHKLEGDIQSELQKYFFR